MSTFSQPLAPLLAHKYLTPKIPVGGWATRASETTYYWRGDIERMLEIVAKYKQGIAAKEPGAKEAYKEFRERRIARVISVMQVCESVRYRCTGSLLGDSVHRLAKVVTQNAHQI